MRGILRCFIRGGSGLSSNLKHTLLYTISDRKRTLFLTPSIDKCYPFHIPLLEIPLTVVNSLSLKYGEQITNLESFSSISQP